MAKSRAMVVAGKADLASKASTASVIEALRESSGKVEFSDYSETSSRSRSVSEISALLGLVSRGRADIAVVEAGELPLKFSRKLEIGAMMKRGNPFNVIISNEETILDELPADISIAVGDPGLKGQLLNYRDDIDFVDCDEDYAGLREMLDHGETGGFVARAWEVELLGRQDEVVEVFTPSICMPPAGQGTVVLIVRAGDRKAAGVVREINHPASFAEVILERTFLGTMSKDGKGGIGVLAEFEDGEYELSAVIASPDGSTKIASEIHGWAGDELNVVGSLVEDLFEKGGGEIIEMYRNIPEE
jgi:hydroxymethylbilane synthase